MSPRDSSPSGCPESAPSRNTCAKQIQVLSIYRTLPDVFTNAKPILVLSSENRQAGGCSWAQDSRLGYRDSNPRYRFWRVQRFSKFPVSPPGVRNKRLMLG